MTELTRYDWGKRDDGEWDILPFTDGDYVKYADVAHLEQQAARLANLPGLPEEYLDRVPFIDETTYSLVMSHRELVTAVLNTCYPPAPGQGVT